MEIVELKLSQLKPYDKNVRKHEDYGISAIMASIEEFGFCDPIGVWSNENVIVEGHGRYQAAKRLKMKTVPCIRLDELTNEQRRAYALAHNKTAELSSWLDGTLFDELNEISMDMTKFGFEETPDINDFDMDFTLPDGDKPEIESMSFTLHRDQKSLIEYALSIVGDDVSETFGNTNKNGNALYEIVKQWAEQKRLK